MGVADAPLRCPMYIDGNATESASGQWLATYEPATQRHLADLALGGDEDLRRAVAAARNAFDGGHWPAMTAAQRAVVLRRIAVLLDAERDRLAELEVRDSGATIRKASRVDVPGAVAAFEWCAWWAERLGDTEPTEPSVPGRYLRWQPVGVVAVILPWNFPLLLGAWRVAAALAAGNTCVVKPASLTSVTMVELARIAHAAGLPPGVLNVVLGTGARVGESLATAPGVDLVTFTGSDEVADRLHAAAGPSGPAVRWSLGGKSANIIRADADLDLAASATVWGSFFHNGQICTSAARCLVAEDVYDDFLNVLLDRCSALTFGDPLDLSTDLGPLISRQHVRTVRRAVQRAVSDGARLLHGGDRPEPAMLPAMLDVKAYLRPTVLADVRPDAWVAQEEIFGPVLSVIPVRSDEHALAVANDSRFGLSGAVWSADTRRARWLAERMRAEQVWINDYRMVDVTMPPGDGPADRVWERLTNDMDQYRLSRSVRISAPGDRARYELLSAALAEARTD